MKPYKKAQEIPLEGLLDRRRRLTEEDKEHIRRMYAIGKYGHRAIARMFNVSRSLIRIVVNPEVARKTRERFKAHWKDYARKRTKAQHAADIRSVRNYKYGLYKAGIIKGEENASKEDRADELSPAQGAGH